MARSLDDWIAYIQTLHARTIDLTLERVSDVYQRMYPEGVPYRVITVGGTNGKGSTVELLASIYRHAGFQTGKYTSPHLVDFSERFNIGGEPVDDAALMAGFDRIEQARAGVSLTFFEFGTLLAIDLFARAEVEVAIMEVGLGGRLDAVNILDPDVSIITSIALDHTAWLGDTVEQIMTEKFGITRPDVPCVIAMPDPPDNLSALAREKQVPLFRVGHEFSYQLSSAKKGLESPGWDYQKGTRGYRNLPLPFGQSGHQLQNAAAAVTTVELMQPRFPVDTALLRHGLAAARVRGRCQIVQTAPLIIVDVAHNPASVAALKTFIDSQGIQGSVIALCGMLKDKEIRVALGEISPIIDQWYVATIDDERGTSAEQMATLVKSLAVNGERSPVVQYEHARAAFDAASRQLSEHDCLVVFGSFFISGDIIAHLQKRDNNG